MTITSQKGLLCWNCLLNKPDSIWVTTKIIIHSRGKWETQHLLGANPEVALMTRQVEWTEVVSPGFGSSGCRTCWRNITLTRWMQSYCTAFVWQFQLRRLASLSKTRHHWTRRGPTSSTLRAESESKHVGVDHTWMVPKREFCLALWFLNNPLCSISGLTRFWARAALPATTPVWAILSCSLAPSSAQRMCSQQQHRWSRVYSCHSTTPRMWVSLFLRLLQAHSHHSELRGNAETWW